MSKIKLPTKQAVETFKTVLIAVLITGIVAFIGGMKYHAVQAVQIQPVTVEQSTPKE